MSRANFGSAVEWQIVTVLMEMPDYWWWVDGHER